MKNNIFVDLPDRGVFLNQDCFNKSKKEGTDMKRIILFLLVLGAVMVVTGQLHDKALAADPVTVTFDVWISPTASPAGPPYTPVHDCLTLDFDGANWTMLLQGCGGPAGPAWVTPPTAAGPFNSFGGKTCYGISFLGWYGVGTTFGWTGDVIGGIAARWPKTWGFEGVRNDECIPPEEIAGMLD